MAQLYLDRSRCCLVCYLVLFLQENTSQLLDGGYFAVDSRPALVAEVEENKDIESADMARSEIVDSVVDLQAFDMDLESGHIDFDYFVDTALEAGSGDLAAYKNFRQLNQIAADNYLAAAESVDQADLAA